MRVLTSDEEGLLIAHDNDSDDLKWAPMGIEVLMDSMTELGWMVDFDGVDLDGEFSSWRTTHRGRLALRAHAAYLASLATMGAT